MKEKKNPMSCFDDDIGDDFLSAWKPSKMNSVPNLDFECSQVNAPEKTFKLPENFDLDMDFGSGLGLNSKLSSFDIDLDFLKSPKHSDSAKENCGGARMSHSQTSSDALQASSGHDASSLPGREREDVVSKNSHAEENSAMESHDQVDAKVTSKAGDSGETLTWGSQKEMAKTPVDFSDKRVLKFDQETSNDEIKGTAHDRSFSKSFEAAASSQGWHTASELLDTARETSEQPTEDVIEGASTLSAKEQQEHFFLPAQAVSKEDNTVAGEILNDKDTEDVSPKRIETKTERRSFQGTLQEVTKEQSLGLQSFVEELTPNHIETKIERRSIQGMLHGVTKEQSCFEIPSVAEEATLKHIETKVERKSFRGMLQGVTKEQSSFGLQSVAEETTPKHIETKTERKSSLRGTLQGVTKEQSLELQSVGLVTNLENVAKQTDMQPPSHRNLGRSPGTVPEIQDDKEQTGQKDTDPLKDIAADQVTRTSAAEHGQELKTPSLLPKVLKKVELLNSSSPLGAKLKSTAPKHSLSKAFMSLKPTQVSALRTSRSHALPPLRFEKQIAAPKSKADEGELQSNLKAQVNVETRSSLQKSGPSLTRTTLGKKRGPPAIEESAKYHTKASADVPERSDNEAPEKRPKLQAAHRISTEQESNQFKLLNAGQGKIMKMPIPAIEKLNISKLIPQAASHGQSRPPSSLSRLISLTRLQPKDLGSTSAARIELPRAEDIFVGTNSLCVQSSLSHGQAVDPATAEIMKKTASGMNHKPESNYHGLKKPQKIDSHSVPKVSHPPLKDSRGGCADSEMHEEVECNKVKVEVSCPELLLEDIMKDQASAKESTRDSKNICKTTAYYSVELDKIMSMLKQKQRRANDLLAEAMAHNAKMKYLLDSKNQEKISILQKSIVERLEGVKLQAAGNRAKRCEWCEEHREDEAAVLIKEHCSNVH